MSKVAALKKATGDPRGTACEQAKNCRLPAVEIPGELMAAVQRLVKEKGCSMAQFWKEAADLRLQTERLEGLLEQIARAEQRLQEIKEREQLLDEREVRIAEVESRQAALYDERLNEIEKMARELEEEYQARLAQAQQAALRQEEEHRDRLDRIEAEIRERSEEYRRHLELEYQEKEKDLVRREARVQVREEIAQEKEKFWSAVYDAVVKLTRVCGAVK
ncbi:MAG: hypothetical protein K6T29_07635 [Peptococcaceae bacterium]|nr:hypothetical protein [Peptococcaceae bacterium]